MSEKLSSKGCLVHYGLPFIFLIPSLVLSCFVLTMDSLEIIRPNNFWGLNT